MFLLAKILVTAIIVYLLFYHSPLSSSAQERLDLYSESVLLMDGKNGEIIYKKQGEKQMYPASITKIVTGILALEMGKPQEQVIISEETTTIEGTRVYLLEDEVVSLERLVQGLMISSGNDAGHAIAEHLAGSEEDFSEKMNEFIRKRLDLQNTNFTNPHGLFNENHYTTAYDMAEITRYALSNEDFREIVATKEMEWNGKGWETTIFNHNRMLWNYDGAFGVKNGFVQRSGFTLVTAAERNNRELIVVVLNAGTADQSYQDTIRLLDYGFKNYAQEEMKEKEFFLNTNPTPYYPNQLIEPLEKFRILKLEVIETREERMK
ncbi:D-alanyl-D-alanine carboxypeptidase family protein [Thalassorhabdus alkalitolerans]|uniref:D-alanyl-D-alanine carboxypeptidase family protein n=1 Tax=Thalassorhabdus alkalitolerans TaxID=2282697 RepID=A0ABW0YKG3_9BACI